MPQPKTKASVVNDLLNQFADSVVKTDDYNRMLFKRIERECDDIAKTDAVLSSLTLAFLHSTVGNFETSERWFLNAERIGGFDRAQVERLTSLVNHGFATRALEIEALAYQHRANNTLMEIAEKFCTIGAFHGVVKAVKESQSKGEVLKMTGIYALAQDAVEVMDQLGVTDAQFAAMVDVAGELLRENRLLWQTSFPDIRVLKDQDGGPSLSFEYRVGLSPREAVDLGWTLTERLIERGLDRPGINLDFLGIKLQAAA